jgi:hypothetical protein
MPTVAEVLRDRVSLDIACVDRVLLNGYVKDLQLPGGVIRFIREQKGWPIPSPAMLGTVSDGYRAAVERFAAAQGLEIVTFAKGESKEAIAQAHLTRFPGRHGVVLIGKAQERASAYKGRRTDKGSKVWFTYSRCSVQVTHYYFYLLDEDFGLVFIKVCTYLPFEVKVCFNGHEWAKQQLRGAGIAFEPLENGFAACADSARLQAVCANLTGATVQAFFDRWVDTLPWPLGAAERRAGYRHLLSVWQLEVSRTQVFVDPEQGRALVEALIRENLDLGRPDRVRLLFDRPVTVRTPGAFYTQVMQHGVLPSIRVHYKHSALKQYLKEGRALRTEAMINNPGDFGSPRGIAHFDALVALGHTLNGRLLAMARLSQDGFVPLEAVRPLGQPTVAARGRRAPALRFGDPRVMAVLAAVAQHAHLPAGLANRTLRPHVAALLGLPLRAYSSARMSYDLRRLRLKGLLRRRPKSHTYVLTPLGARVAVFFTKLYARCFRPGLAALVPDQPRPAPLARALTAVDDALHALVDEARFAPAAA